MIFRQSSASFSAALQDLENGQVDVSLNVAQMHKLTDMQKYKWTKTRFKCWFVSKSWEHFCESGTFAFCRSARVSLYIHFWCYQCRGSPGKIIVIVIIIITKTTMVIIIIARIIILLMMMMMIVMVIAGCPCSAQPLSLTCLQTTPRFINNDNLWLYSWW